MKRNLIADKKIEIRGDVTDAQVDIIGDAFDSIDFESILRQKLEEAGLSSQCVAALDIAIN